MTPVYTDVVFVAVGTPSRSDGGADLSAVFRVAEMVAAGRTGSVVTLLCDGGERYAHTYYDDAWLAGHGLDLTPWTAVLERFLRTAEWRPDGHW